MFVHWANTFAAKRQFDRFGRSEFPGLKLPPIGYVDGLAAMRVAPPHELVLQGYLHKQVRLGL
jgi:hypothetical protein